MSVGIFVLASHTFPRFGQCLWSYGIILWFLLYFPSWFCLMICQVMGLDLPFLRFLADKYIVQKSLYSMMLCTSKSKQCKWPSISLVVWYISYNLWIPIPFLCSWILHGAKLKLCTSLLSMFINVSSCLAVIWVSMYFIYAFLVFHLCIYVSAHKCIYELTPFFTAFLWQFEKDP